jgi:hypothetical protein
LCSVRTVGRFWRLSASTDGVAVCDSAISQASAVSTASAGRKTSMLGVARSMARCSTGWCVGPSSPSPMLSWVITYCTGSPISAESRIDGRA